MSNFFSGATNLDDIYHRVIGGGIYSRPSVGFLTSAETTSQLSNRYVERGPVVNTNFIFAGINLGQIFGGRINSAFDSTYAVTNLFSRSIDQNEASVVIIFGDGGNGVGVVTDRWFEDSLIFDSYGISNLSGGAVQVRFILVSGPGQMVGGSGLNTWLTLSSTREIIVRNFSFGSFDTHVITAEFRLTSNQQSLGSITYTIETDTINR